MAEEAQRAIALLCSFRHCSWDIEKRPFCPCLVHWLVPSSKELRLRTMQEFSTHAAFALIATMPEHFESLGIVERCANKVCSLVVLACWVISLSCRNIINSLITLCPIISVNQSLCVGAQASWIPCTWYVQYSFFGHYLSFSWHRINFFPSSWYDVVIWI